MKKTLPAILLLFALYTQAQKIEFIDNNWEKARAEAKQQKKYLFADAYTDWCYWCKVMDKETFSDKEVIKFMSENFVSLKLEMEHNYGVNVARKYRVSSFPTFLVFSPDGKLVRRLSGYLEVAPFLAELKSALNIEMYPGYQGISETVDLNFPDFYSKSFTNNGHRDKTDSVSVNSFLSGQKDLFAEINYSVLVRFASLLSETNRNFLFQNKTRYEELFGKGEIDNAIYSVQNKLLEKAIRNKSEEDLKSALIFIEKNQPENIESIKDLTRLNYYKGIGDWNSMANEVDVFIAKNGYQGNYLNDWSWTVYEKCDDMGVIKKAVSWMKPVITEKSDYATTDTYAALLYKAGENEQAKIFAQKAIELGKTAGEKTEETEKLLKKINAK